MKKSTFKKTGLLLTLIPALMLAGCSDNESPKPLASVDSIGSTSIDQQNLQTALDGITLGVLNQNEIDGLYFMREEEKLAQDVYRVLYDKWSQTIFDNISNSEKTHTDAVLSLLNRYNLTDPAEGKLIGEFTNLTLQGLNDSLVATGSNSLIDALMVGAEIEEIDMIDINHYIDQIDQNDDIVLVYENLLKGSRNHLRSFVSNLEKQGVIYVPQHMDATAYQAIIDSPMER